LLDIYPTLLDLCGLPQKPGLEGSSLLSLLKDPRAPWERPAVTTHGRNNHAVRDERWRYIRYADGSEELYDHHADPPEWKNLAGDAQYMTVKNHWPPGCPRSTPPTQEIRHEPCCRLLRTFASREKAGRPHVASYDSVENFLRLGPPERLLLNGKLMSGLSR
jgi:hypothetical protein